MNASRLALLCLALCLLATGGSVYAPGLYPDKLVVEERHLMREATHEVPLFIVKGDGNGYKYSNHNNRSNADICTRLDFSSGLYERVANENYLFVPAVPDTWVAPGSLPSFEMDAPPVPLRVWLTHYVAGGVAASGIPSAVGQAASYAHRAENGKILAARLNPLAEITPFGTIVVIPDVGEFALADTGAGFEDGRLWIDIGVSTRGEAIERGARWIDVYIIEGRGE